MVVDFSGETVAELEPRHPDVSKVGGSFDDVEVFQLFEEAEELETLIEKLVSTLEKAANEVLAQGRNAAATAALLRDSLSDPQVKKVTGS